MQDLVEKLATLLKQKDMMIVTAESCTGGLLATALTHKAGASAYFDRGFVTYSNEAKNEQLDVSQEILDQHGAVSAPSAEAMAKGALEHSKAGISISITGVAGPDGGTEDKPVGTVFFGYALKGGSSGSIEHKFDGSREQIQTQSAITALKSLIAIMDDQT